MKAEKCASMALSIRCTLASTPDDVRKALADVAAKLACAPSRPAPGDMWEVAIAEVLNNIVEHAYQQRSDGVIEMQLEFGATHLSARFTDYGLPMPGGTPPSGTPADLDVPLQDLPEGGFGWFLIRSLADRLEYSQEDGTNRLYLSLPISCVTGPT